MGRKQAENLMESTCIITRSVPGTVNHSTGAKGDTSTQIYSGKCRLRFAFVRPEQKVAEGQQIAQDKAILSLPVTADGSADVRANDTAVITMSPILDPGVIVTVLIEAPFAQTHATARRFPVQVSN